MITFIYNKKKYTFKSPAAGSFMLRSSECISIDVDRCLAEIDGLKSKLAEIEAEITTQEIAHREEIFKLNDKCVAMRRAKQEEIDRLIAENKRLNDLVLSDISGWPNPAEQELKYGPTKLEKSEQKSGEFTKTLRQVAQEHQALYDDEPGIFPPIECTNILTACDIIDRLEAELTSANQDIIEAYERGCADDIRHSKEDIDHLTKALEVAREYIGESSCDELAAQADIDKALKGGGK